LTVTKIKTKAASWLGERIDLSGIRELLEHKRIPVHSATKWYYFGGITLFLFVIQVFTGTLLMLYYRLTVAEAFDSVRFIMTRVEIRMADPLDSQLVCESVDFRRICTHV